MRPLIFVALLSGIVIILLIAVLVPLSSQTVSTKSAVAAVPTLSASPPPVEFPFGSPSPSQLPILVIAALPGEEEQRHGNGDEGGGEIELHINTATATAVVDGFAGWGTWDSEGNPEASVSFLQGTNLDDDVIEVEVILAGGLIGPMEEVPGLPLASMEMEELEFGPGKGADEDEAGGVTADAGKHDILEVEEENVMPSVETEDQPFIPSPEAEDDDERMQSAEVELHKQAEEEDHTLGYSHVAHAVPGRAYQVFDLDGDGIEEVVLDGSRSHSHYYDAGPPPQLAEIISWVWFDADHHGMILAEGSTPFLLFALGETKIGLRVVDSAGNTHEEITSVTVLPSRREGVYCYYYQGIGMNGGISIEWNPVLGMKPVYGEEVSGVEFKNIEAFPEKIRGGDFQVRCTFSLQIEEERSVRFTVQHYGEMQMLVDVLDSHNVVMENFAGGLQTTSTVYELGIGVHFFQVLYIRREEAPGLLKLTEGGGILLHDLARQLPLIYDISPMNSTLGGGGKLRLRGSGFWNDPNVYFGGVEGHILAPDKELSTAELIVVEVPAVEEEKVVEVSIGNRLGGSNAVQFEYAKDALEPVHFKEGSLKAVDDTEYKVKLITNVQYGPDHRLYLASLDSFVYSLGMDKNMRVTDQCQSESFGYLRTVIGLAFNWADTEVVLYASSSIFFWGGSGLTGDFLWANGQISVLKPNYGGHCLGIVGEPIISGLPVSNHDHGVNSLIFDDDGMLHFQVGAATNAGVAAETIGNIDESPLSAASLVADIFKSGFNGTVVYDSHIPGQARQIGGDVEVFSPGWRNSFDLVLHSNGFLYATDNGANSEFGNRSTGCMSEDLISPYDSDDKISKLVRGRYAGHANRNRGREDEEQCVWKGPNDSASGSFMTPLVKVESSTDGIVEYTADLFKGQMKGDLLASKYATNDKSDEGKVYRVKLDERGEKVGEVETLWEGSGLSIETGVGGEILMPRLYEGRVMVLTPVVEWKGDGRLVGVKPFRGTVEGGNEVIVRVDGGGLKSVAIFDGRECVKVFGRWEGGFRCVVPAAESGGGSVKVSIRTGDGEVLQTSPGWDYRYMRI